MPSGYPIDMTTQRVVRALKTRRHLNNREISELVGVSRSAVQDITHRQSLPCESAASLDRLIAWWEAGGPLPATKQTPSLRGQLQIALEAAKHQLAVDQKAVDRLVELLADLAE